MQGFLHWRHINNLGAVCTWYALNDETHDVPERRGSFFITAVL